MPSLLRTPAIPALGLALVLGSISPAHAQNPEDEPVPDEDIPTAPVPPKPDEPEDPTPPAPKPPTPELPAPEPSTSNPSTSNPSTPNPNQPPGGETVTVPKAVWEKLLRDVEELKAKANGAPPVATTPAPMAPAWPAPSDAATGASASGATASSAGSPGTRNYLLLPDISLVGTSQYLFSNDKRDEGRNSLDTEAELGVQGFVYPNVKYDTFITGNPGEGEFGVEEGYITYLGAAKGLNVQIGRKFAPFGRTGELHPHSWLYSRQFLARQNLVAGEALAGNGINLNYLIPTGKSFFARLSLGAFSGGEEASGRANTSDPSDPFEGGGPNRVGAGLSRFYNARLWLSKPLGDKNEIELGFSRAQGRAFIQNLSGVDNNGNEIVDDAAGRLKLTGVDLSFRHFTGVNKRLLLRSEYFKYQPRNLPTTDASGYYIMGNYRFNRFHNVGLIYEGSDFANAPGLKEKATSLIYTRSFSERYYVRFTGIHGDRPGQSNYNEGRVQFVIGLGPHTHELE